MKDISDQLRAQLGEDMATASATSLLTQARADAEKKIVRRRIGIGGGATALAVAATTLALTLGPGAPGTAAGRGIAPAGQGTALASSAPATTTSASATSPLTTAPVATTSAPSTTKPATAPSRAAAPLAQDHGYYAHPEVMKPGEPPLWDETPQPYQPDSEDFKLMFADQPGSESVPRAIPNPARGPYPDLRLTLVSGADTRTAMGVAAICDPSVGVGSMQEVGGRHATYWHRTAFAATGDGDMSTAIDRSTVDINIHQFPDASVNLPQAFLTRKMGCVPTFGKGDMVEVPGWTVPGTSHAWLAHPSEAAAATDLYGYRTTLLLVQRGPYLVGIESTAKTQAAADAQAQWFLTQVLAKVPGGQA